MAQIPPIFNNVVNLEAIVLGRALENAPLATTLRLLRDTSRFIRDVMDRPQLAQRTD